MSRRAALLLLSVVAAGCGSSSRPPSKASLAGWKGETISLPPSFAPDMGLEGQEQLLFAPGMFDASAADYFSYVFVLRYPTHGALDGDESRELLRLYYKGLMDAVSKDKENRPEPAPATQVELVSDDDGSLLLVVKTFDAFVTMEPLELTMKVQLVKAGQGSCLRARVSPQSLDHDLWNELDRALASLPC